MSEKLTMKTELELLKSAKARIEALEQLLVCYRIGKRPTEKLFNKLEKHKGIEQDIQVYIEQKPPCKG